MSPRSCAVGGVLLATLLAIAPAGAAEDAAAPVPAPAADTVGAWGYNSTYAGAVFRPQFCLVNCTQSGRAQNRYLMTYGVEVGDRFFGLAIRYGQERRLDPADGILRTVHEITTDLRLSYDWRVGPVLLAPFLEVSPMILFGGANGVHLIVRPGFRATFLLTTFLDLAVEPFALDIDWYRFERYGSFSRVDLSISLRYSVSLSLHARW
jgi:hypothetical protein